MAMGPVMMMDPSMMMGAPILVPAGPGGMAPMIMAPIGGGRGGRGGGGRGKMSPAGGGGGPSYFDLDNPKNNRAVLDYGDL